MLDCYIINRDCDQERWDTTSERFHSQGLNVIRVPAIEGKDLTFPHPDFAAWRFFFQYGRRMVPNEVACYLSHIKALKTFLETDKDHAMVCEDDVFPLPLLRDVVNDAMRYFRYWDLLRLNGGKPTKGTTMATLSGGFRLCCGLKTTSGAGANIVNRHAAETIIKKCLPMRLAYDVTLYYDWPLGIREVVIQPFPVRFDKEMNSNSVIGKRNRYPLLHPASLRFFVSVPYRILSRMARKIARIHWALQNSIWVPVPMPLESGLILTMENDFIIPSQSTEQERRAA